MSTVVATLSVISFYMISTWSLEMEGEHPNSYNTSYEPRPMTVVMKLIEEATIVCMIEGECPEYHPSIINDPKPCIDGLSNNTYPCSNIDLLGFLNLQDLGSSSTALGNDIWGWKDPQTNRLYALTGQTDGSTIVDVTDPINPDPLVFIPSNLAHHVNWRDMKIFNNGNFFIVADSSNHGIQYGNMTQLIQKSYQYRKTLNNATTDIRKRIYRADLKIDIGVDTQVGNVHNVAYNEQTGYIYIVGSTQSGRSANSRGGLVMYDVATIDITANELNLVGVFADDGYTHDTECVVYRGPDEEFVGREICFGYNENSLTIVDVSIKSAPIMISRTEYETSRYSHQGWLTNNQRYALLDDELDEYAGSVTSTTTYIFDCLSLRNPVLLSMYSGPTNSIDHNLYIIGENDRVYEANYRAGLRVLDGERIPQGILTEIAYFDMYPQDDANQFGHGIWSSYPYWMEDENEDYHFVVAQTKAQGFFVLKPPQH